jgi:multiple sugar transport system permease protein
MKVRRFADNLFVYVLLILGAVIMMLPFLFMVVTALQPGTYVLSIPPNFWPSHPTLQNFVDVWSANNFGRYFLNSAIVATTSTVITVMFSSMIAFTFARYTFPGKTPLYYTMLVTLMLPTLVLIIPQFVLAKNLHLLNSLQGLIVVYSAGIPLYVFLLRGFFEDIPQDLADAAAIDGAGIWTLYWRIMMPLARPALATVTIFSFLGNWDEFTWALTSISDSNLFTLPIALQFFQGQHGTQYGLVFAASLIVVLPVVAVFVVFQRHFIKGIMSSAVKG